jgi:putative alpha-1,2-mannosidase|tara:strand:- start:32 stop:385 length:354 start_codon:yes stop_codon:yes gene_type:complete
MTRKTQTQILNDVLVELQEIKKGLPNGEIALMQKSLEDLEEGQKSLKSEIRTIQKRLFNPDSGIIVEVNKNTEFMKETQPKLKEVDNVVSWKGNVTKALWVVYSAIIGVIIKLLFWN